MDDENIKNSKDIKFTLTILKIFNEYFFILSKKYPYQIIFGRDFGRELYYFIPICQFKIMINTVK